MKILTDLEYRPGLRLTRQAAVALFVDTLERSGAVFSLKPDNTFLCNFDGIQDFDHAKADAMAQAVLELRDEIRAELIGRRIAH